MTMDDEPDTLPPVRYDDEPAAGRPSLPAQAGDYKFSKSSIAWLYGDEAFAFTLTSQVSASSHFSLDDVVAGRVRQALKHELETDYRYEFLCSRPPLLRIAAAVPAAPKVFFSAPDDASIRVSSSDVYDRIRLEIESQRARLSLDLDPPVAITLYDVLAGSWSLWPAHDRGDHDDPRRDPACPWCAFWLRGEVRPLHYRGPQSTTPAPGRK